MNTSPLRDLRSALAFLEGQPDGLLRIDQKVSLEYELASFADNMYGGPALLFANVAESAIPVVANVYSKRRMAGMLGVDEKDLIPHVVSAVRSAIKSPAAPVLVESGPCQDVAVTDNIDLRTMLPNPTQTPRDSGDYIGACVVIWRFPDSGLRSMFYARGITKGGNRFQLYFHALRGLTLAYREVEKLGRPLQIAAVIGAEPAVAIAAAAHGPLVESIGGEYKLAFAGSLAGRPIEMVRCKAIDLEVPAQGEIVIEAEMLPGTREWTDSLNPTGILGPGGTGYFSRSKELPVCIARAVTHRSNPIYEASFGRQAFSMVNLLSEAAMQDDIKRIASRQFIDLNYRHPLAIIKFKKESEVDDGIPKNVLMRALSADRDCHMAIIVDEDIDIYDPWAVWTAMVTRTDWKTGFFIVPSARGHGVVPVAREQAGIVDKVAIDSTMPFGRREKFLVNQFVPVDVARFIPNFVPRPWYEHGG